MIVEQSKTDLSGRTLVARLRRGDPIYVFDDEREWWRVPLSMRWTFDTAIDEANIHERNIYVFEKFENNMKTMFTTYAWNLAVNRNDAIRLAEWKFHLMTKFGNATYDSPSIAEFRMYDSARERLVAESYRERYESST